MSVSEDTRARITAAADRIYQDQGRDRFPRVDDVRKVAKVSMSDVTAVMKDWRRKQMAGPRTVEVPPAVQDVFRTSLEQAWLVATDTANAMLKEAQSVWDAQQAESEQLRADLAQSYDALDAARAADRAEIERLNAMLDAASRQAADREAQLKAEMSLARQHAATECERLRAECATAEKEAAISAAEVKSLMRQLEAAEQRYSDLLARIAPGGS